MIVNPGDKLPAAYLERFDPAENVVYRFSVLATSAIALEFHWVDLPSKDKKGTFQCIQGICCQALGRRSQNYNVPIYVYRQQGSTEGDIYVWQMTPARWKKFSDLALQVDLTQYDLTFSAQKRGMGLDWTFSAIPDQKYRDYWSVEQREQLAIATQSFYQMGESTLINPMNYNEWAQLLHDVGYDVQNQCWPGGQSPMNSGQAFQSIGGAVKAGVSLPPPPPAGFAPVTHQMPVYTPTVNAPQSVVMQPVQPQIFGQVPNSGYVVNPQLSQPMVSPVSGMVPSAPVVSQTVQPIAGTVPVSGQVPVQSQQVVPTVQAINNEVPNAGVQEITADELNSMLSD